MYILNLKFKKSMWKKLVFSRRTEAPDGRVFSTALIKSGKAPTFSKDYLEYDGYFYIIGEGHKSFIAEKQSDDDNYILTLAAIAKELNAREMTSARVHLAVGLPLKWVQAQRESFRAYLMQNKQVQFRYKGRAYEVEIAGCTVMSQCYSAVAENLKDFMGMNLLADIGNGTMNIMYLNNGRAIESKSWTEKLGVFQCMKRIHKWMDTKEKGIAAKILNEIMILKM